MVPRHTWAVLLAVCTAAAATPARAAVPKTLYLQTWEAGAAGWFSVKGTTEPVSLPYDPTAPSPDHSQRLSYTDDDGSYLSPLIPVQPGATLCVTAWINWVGGGWPGIGLNRFSSTWDFEGDGWLMGHASLATGLGPMATPVLEVDGWHKYSSEVTLPASTYYIQLKDQLWWGAWRVPSRPDLAFIDSIAVRYGSCTDPSGDPVNQCPVVSAGPAPVLECSAGGAYSTLDGLAWDPDGDLLTYDWGKGPTTAQVYEFFALGQHQRTLTVADQLCSASDSTTVSVFDTKRPALSCPPSVETECKAGGAAVDLGKVYAYDQCQGQMPAASNALPFYPLGKTTVGYLAVDKSGNSATCSTTVSVVDTAPPTMTCPVDLTLQCGGPRPVSPPASDVCAGNVPVATLGPAKVALGGHDYTHVAYDKAGHYTACKQVVTGIDTLAPVLSCPAPHTAECGGAAKPAGVQDACDAAPKLSMTPLPKQTGNVIVTYTASDAAGHTVSCQTDVTVVDTLPPGMHCPALQTVECGDKPTGAATAADTCDPTVTVQAGNVSTGKAGMTLWPWTAQDGSGNEAWCAATVNVVDTKAPSISCPAPAVVDCGGQLPPAQASDTCEGLVTVSGGQVASTKPGSYPATFTATDASGNKAYCGTALTVVDKTAPGITCPQSASFECGLGGGLGPALSKDNCVGTVVVSGQAPATDEIGATEVEYTAVDGSGNIAKCTATQTVVDTLEPKLTCPAAQTVECKAQPKGTASVEDLCDPNVQVQPGAVSTAKVGQTLWPWTAKDGSGNEAWCAATVSVVDTTAPVVTCPVAAKVECGGTLPGATGSDACADTVSVSAAQGSTAKAGVVPVSYTAKDPSGNQATCSTSVTVVDTQAPSITCPSSASFECGLGGGLGPASASDICLGEVKVSGLAPATDKTGAATVTYTAVDASGNTAKCTATQTVVDTLPPKLACPAAQVVECKSQPKGTATVEDLCDPNVQVQPGSVSTAQVGAAVWPWTAKDGSGNEAFCAASLTVVDTQAPVLACPVGAKVECGGTLPNASASDVCADQVQVSAGQGSTAKAGVVPVSYSAKDPSGNQALCSTTVTVVDTVSPSITCPKSATFECGEGGGLGPASGSDTCLGGVQVSGKAPATDAVGVKKVTYTAIDASGNTAKCTATQTVVDTKAPSISCPAAVKAECGQPVPLGKATASDGCDDSVQVTSSAPAKYLAGDHEVWFTAMDDSGNTAKCMTKVEIVDTTPAVVTVQGFGTLWPPSHKYETLGLESCGIEIVDGCGGKLSLKEAGAKITCVTSDEPENSTGDGNTLADIVVIDGTTVQVRGERKGDGDGRIYKVGFVVHDKAGNQTFGECQYLVPHDQTKPVVDSGAQLQVCAP